MTNQWNRPAIMCSENENTRVEDGRPTCPPPEQSDGAGQ